MKITQRGVVIVLLGMLTLTNIVLTPVMFSLHFDWVGWTEVAAALVMGSLLFAYWRYGWEPARYIAVILIALLSAATNGEPYLTHRLAFIPIVPPALALILAGPAWVLATAAFSYGVLLIRAGGQGPFAEPIAYSLYGLITVGMLFGRLIADGALRTAEESARRAEAARTDAERQAHALEAANEATRVQLEQQIQILELVTSLETPVVPLAEGVLFAPIVGHIDSRRADALTARLLQEAGAQHPRLVVLDIAGVATIDTSVARALLNMARALRLLGCEVTISGISASVALSLIHLGVSLDDVRTARNPQEALAHHLGTTPLPLGRTS